jgi:hypothetical protein
LRNGRGCEGKEDRPITRKECPWSLELSAQRERDIFKFTLIAVYQEETFQKRHWVTGKEQ